MRSVRLGLTAALALTLAGTGIGQAKDKKDDSPAIMAARDFDSYLYPSTYRVSAKCELPGLKYRSAPSAINRATPPICK